MLKFLDTPTLVLYRTCTGPLMPPAEDQNMEQILEFLFWSSPTYQFSSLAFLHMVRSDLSPQVLPANPNMSGVPSTGLFMLSWSRGI